MTSLKGKGQRARACPAAVINIKEPLVVVEGWKGFYVSDALVTSQAYSLIFIAGCCEGAAPRHTDPIDRPSCR